MAYNSRFLAAGAEKQAARGIRNFFPNHTTDFTTACNTQQLSLLSPPAATPDSPLRFEPSPWHDTRNRSTAICNYNGKPFSGSYFDAEVDFLARYFQRWRGAIPPSEFGVAAEMAIAAARGVAK